METEEGGKNICSVCQKEKTKSFRLSLRDN